MKTTTIWRALAAPFHPDDLTWRVGRSGTKNNTSWIVALAYLTSRAVQDRLDSVVGPDNWKVDYREWTGGTAGVLCELSIRVNGEWITKSDGAEQTEIEPVKGGFSDAFKRTAVLFGIGRYLYDLKNSFAVIDAEGRFSAKIEGTNVKWNPPNLPEWAVPVDYVKRIRDLSEQLTDTMVGEFEGIPDLPAKVYLRANWARIKGNPALAEDTWTVLQAILME